MRGGDIENATFGLGRIFLTATAIVAENPASTGCWSVEHLGCDVLTRCATMPPKSAAHKQRLSALRNRISIEPPPVDAATPRHRTRRTSTPLDDGAASNADEADVDTGEPQYLPDSPTIDSVVEDSAEASVEDTMLVERCCARARVWLFRRGRGSTNPQTRILSQTSAFASQTWAMCGFASDPAAEQAGTASMVLFFCFQYPPSSQSVAVFWCCRLKNRRFSRPKPVLKQ